MQCFDWVFFKPLLREIVVGMFRVFVLLAFCLISIDGHGYLYEPVARSSAWLVDDSFRKCCTWPQHMEMFCGGLGHQWNVNGLSILSVEYSIRSLLMKMENVASVVKLMINQ